MKKQTLLKITTFSFATCLAAGIFVCSNPAQASADETTTPPTCNIVAKTLCLEDNIYIRYAIDFQNVEETDQTGVVVWKAPQESYDSDNFKAGTYLEKSTVILDDKYPTFTYTALAAKQMIDVVYARAYVVHGGEYYYSSVQKYSILEYAYNKLGKTDVEATKEEELMELLNAMLAFGGAAQTYANYKTDTLASDDFTFVRVENAHFEDGFNYGLFKKDSTVTVIPDEGYRLKPIEGSILAKAEDGTFQLTVPAEKTIDKTSSVKKLAYSEDLVYQLSEDGSSYSVVGIGTCEDTDIIIPATYDEKPVTSIGAYAFTGWRKVELKSVTIPNSVTSIGEYAFMACDSLTSVAIPANVTSIGASAFAGCRSLTSVTIPNGVTSIETYTFSECSALTSITIPEGVTSIGEGAFTGSGLTSVVIPDSVISIGDSAFYCSGSLTSATIGKGVTSIGAMVFADCGSLTSVTISEGVKTIGDSMFVYCNSLASITIPSTVTSIGRVAFSGCSSLTSVTIPAGVKTIGEVAFQNSGLTEVTIPAGVTSIGDQAFGSCAKLTSIVVEAGNATYKSKDGNLYNADETTLIQYAIGKTESSFTIPDGVTSIGDVAFGACTALTGIAFGKDVTTIGLCAFGWSGLTSVTIPDGITSIGRQAFNGCRDLTSVTLSDSVTNIGEDAFLNCETLVFTEYENAKYLGTATNAHFALIQATSTEITSCTIHEDTKIIADRAFADCNGLTSITIPDGVIYIGEGVFVSCAGLTDVVIGNGVTTIGESAFAVCAVLKYVTIGSGVNNITAGAFSYCKNLSIITVAEGNETYQAIDGRLYSKDGKTLVQYALGEPSNASFTVPEAVTTIGDYAFVGFGLDTVRIGTNVTSIGKGAFQGCTYLKWIYYAGTLDQWKEVEKGSGWVNNPSNVNLKVEQTF